MFLTPLFASAGAGSHFLEAVGRKTVDLGFSGVIDKFEEHWGKWATRWLLFLIGVAVAAACVGLIWEWIVSPILVFIQSPLWTRTLSALFSAALTIGAGTFLGLSLMSSVARWRRAREMKNVVKKTRAESDAILSEARSLLKETETGRRRAAAIMQASILLARGLLEQDKSMSPEERASRLEALGIADDIMAEIMKDDDLDE